MLDDASSSRDEVLARVDAEWWEATLLDERSTVDDYRRSLLRTGSDALAAERMVEQMIHRLNETRIVHDPAYYSSSPRPRLSRWDDGPICQCEIDPDTRTCFLCGFHHADREPRHAVWEAGL